MAAEIEARDAFRWLALEVCFNEAAANGRGNRGWFPCSPLGPPGFNEAAANGRGNLVQDLLLEGAEARFNEAAANGRGNRYGELFGLPVRVGLQ